MWSPGVPLTRTPRENTSNTKRCPNIQIHKPLPTHQLSKKRHLKPGECDILVVVSINNGNLLSIVRNYRTCQACIYHFVIIFLTSFLYVIVSLKEKCSVMFHRPPLGICYEDYDGKRFCEVIASFVRQSGLSQSRVVERTNERSRESAIYMLAPKLQRSTLSRLVRGIDSVSNLTLYRIAHLGLDLPEETCTWLERLRQMEAPVNHTTQPRSVVVAPQKYTSQKDGELEANNLPTWIQEISTIL